MLEQRLQQPAEDHRVGDVGHVELVEADEPPAARDARRDDGERILLVFHLGERRMHVAHEEMEVHARLAANGDGREEAVHQEALAAPDAAPQVDAARDVRRREQLLQRRLPRGAKRVELVGQDLQAVERVRL